LTILSLTKVDVGMMEDVGTSANQLVQLDSNAKIPAVDGSLLTGLGGLSGSSDPTISTNPGTVGTKFINTTDGEIFICTDATAGANVWTNVGTGTGDIYPWLTNSTTQGDNYGYAAGPYNSPAGSQNRIEKAVNFSSDGNGTDWADLTVGRYDCAGTSSATYGYCCGGQPTHSGMARLNVIDKWPFASQTNASDVGDLSLVRSLFEGHMSTTHGYTCGGTGGPAHSPYARNEIDKFSFSSDGNSSDIGNLTAARESGGGSSSSTHGYYAGGRDNAVPEHNWSIRIDKFSFSSDGNATTVGNTVQASGAGHRGRTGTQSYYYGYVLGGGDTETDVIEKYSFASDGNSSDVGDLLAANKFGAGIAGYTKGYYIGGGVPWMDNTIQKFDFASDGNGTDVGNLSSAMAEHCGNAQH